MEAKVGCRRRGDRRCGNEVVRRVEEAADSVCVVTQEDGMLDMIDGGVCRFSCV